jgi:hypothetical protein
VKVDLAIALGQLKADLRGSLSRVNSIQNKYAHEPATRLTTKVTADLWNALPPRLQEELHALFRRRFFKAAEIDADPSVGDTLP